MPTEPPAGLVTAVGQGFDNVQDLVLTTLLPALFGLILIGIGIRVAIKYLRRGASS